MEIITITFLSLASLAASQGPAWFQLFYTSQKSPTMSELSHLRIIVF